MTITEFLATLKVEAGHAAGDGRPGPGARDQREGSRRTSTTQVHPVVGMDVAATAGEDGIGFRESVG